MTPTQKRLDFLTGVGTLTATEVMEWAKELVANPSNPHDLSLTVSIPDGIGPDRALMVSVVDKKVGPLQPGDHFEAGPREGA